MAAERRERGQEPAPVLAERVQLFAAQAERCFDAVLHPAQPATKEPPIASIFTLRRHSTRVRLLNLRIR